MEPAIRTRHFLPRLQDAHEFLNWLLNDISEVLEKEERAAQSAARRASRDASRASSRASSRAHSPTKARSPTKQHGGGGGGPGRSASLQLLSAAAAKAAAARNRPVRTWVHDLFQVGQPLLGRLQRTLPQAHIAHAHSACLGAADCRGATRV